MYMSPVIAVMQDNSVLQSLIDRNEIVLAWLNILEGGGGEDCKVLPVQRNTGEFGTLYDASLADRSCKHNPTCV